MPITVDGQAYPDAGAWNQAAPSMLSSAAAAPKTDLAVSPDLWAPPVPFGTPAPSTAPEDVLYSRVRRAEGTAGGTGYLIYGGDQFTPGAEHPGELARRVGPDGRVTHAAGPGQWQPATWNGLKPDFRAKYGRDPIFSSDADQNAMVWLNAAKIYPGGENKMRADIASGALNTKSLAPQWAGFNASDGTRGGVGGTARMAGRFGGMGPRIAAPGAADTPADPAAIPPSSLSRAMAAPGASLQLQAQPAAQPQAATAAPAIHPAAPLQPIPLTPAPNLYRGYKDALAAVLNGQRRGFGSIFG